MSVCDTARILPDFQGHSEMRLASHVLSSSSDRQRNLFPTSSDQLPSSLSTILTHREAFSEESDGRTRETRRAVSASSFLSRPPPPLLQAAPAGPPHTHRSPPAHGPANHYSAGVGGRKHQEGNSRMAAAQLLAIPTPAASLFPPSRSQSAGRQPKGGRRRPGQAPSASPTPRPAYPGRRPALSLPSPAPPRPRCRRTLQSHRARVPLPSTPLHRPPQRPSDTVGAAPRTRPLSRARAPVPQSYWLRRTNGAGPAANLPPQLARRGGARAPGHTPETVAQQMADKKIKTIYPSAWASREGVPRASPRSARSRAPREAERARGRGTSLAPCSRFESAETPAIGTAFRGGGGIEADPESVMRPLIRAAGGVLRYSTGGGGTCRAVLRMRAGRPRHLPVPPGPPSCPAAGVGAGGAGDEV